MRLLRVLLLLALAAVAVPASAVVNTTTRTVEITGTGGTVFTVPFPFADSASLVVTKVTIATNAEQPLVLGSDYTVTLPIGSVSGKVTTVGVVAATHKLRIERVTPLTQTTAFSSQGAFYPALHEKALDKLTMAIQDNPGEGGGGGAALSNSIPTNVNRSVGAAGVDGTAARADHKHDISTAAPTTTLTLGASAVEGSATSLARSDHTHAIDAAVVGDVQPVGLVASAGTDASVARGDHVHAITAPTINSALSTGAIDANGRVAVRVNSGGTPSLRRRVNIIAGSNVTVAQADDSANEEVDVTISASSGGALADGDYGDVTVGGSGTTMTIDNDVVTNAKAANMATATFKGRTTAGTGDPEDLTAAQATALLNLATTGAKGLAPVLSNVSSQYLDGTGNWSTPAGSGNTPSDATPGAVSTTGSAGASSAYSRGDHVHAITASTVNSAVTGTGLSVTGASNTAGVTGTGGATNAAGVSGQGAGTGAGVIGTGGATGRGGDFTGGASGGVGVRGTGTNGNGGVVGVGNGAGAGVVGTGGATGSGVEGTAGSNGYGVYGVTSSGVGVGGAGGSTGAGGQFTGGTGGGRGIEVSADLTSPINAALRIVPQDTQPTGPNLVGDAYVTSAGVLRMCTVAGTPGTWVDVGASTTNAAITLTGDVTGSGTGSFAATIANDAITNAKAANMANATIKCRTTAGTGDPEDCTAAQATALLDTVTSGAKGLAPASGGGTTNFLRADGTWAAPPGGGSSTLWYRDFAADQFIIVGTGWTVTTGATGPSTANQADYLSFSNSADNGIGLDIVLPTGATNINMTIDAAPASSGFTTNNGVQWSLSCKAKYSTGSYTTVDGAAITFTDNALSQRKTQTWTLSGLSLSADTVARCELFRDTADVDDTLSVALLLLHLQVTVN